MPCFPSTFVRRILFFTIITWAGSWTKRSEHDGTFALRNWKSLSVFRTGGSRSTKPGLHKVTDLPLWGGTTQTGHCAQAHMLKLQLGWQSDGCPGSLAQLASFHPQAWSSFRSVLVGFMFSMTLPGGQFLGVGRVGVEGP